MKLTTHFHLVPGLGMCGAISSLIIVEWCIIKHREDRGDGFEGDSVMYIELVCRRRCLINLGVI
jgi:hypothetical protein